MPLGEAACLLLRWIGQALPREAFQLRVTQSLPVRVASDHDLELTQRHGFEVAPKLYGQQAEGLPAANRGHIDSSKFSGRFHSHPCPASPHVFDDDLLTGCKRKAASGWPNRAKDYPIGSEY